MCTGKKVLIAAGAVVAGVLLVATPIGTFAWNKGQTAVSGVFNWCDSQVTPEEKLRHINQEIAKIDKDIKRHIADLAKREVEVQGVKEKVVALKADQDKRKTDLEALAKALESKETPVSFKGRELNRSALLREVDLRTSTYEARKAELAKMQEVLAAKEKNLDLVVEKITAMRNQQQELRTAVTNLEGRIEIVKTQQVNSNAQIPDASQVNKVKAMVSELEQQLRVEETKARRLEQFGYRETTPVLEVLPKKDPADVLNAARKALESDEPATVAVDKK